MHLGSLPPNALELIAHTNLFCDLPLEDIKKALLYFTRYDVVADEYFFHQGAQADRMFILIEGQIKVTQITPEGQQVVLRIVNPYQIFGCVAALSKGDYPGSAQATKDCMALSLNEKKIQELMKDYPQVSYNAFQIMVKRTHELQDRYRELATEKVERRVAHALLRLVKQNGITQRDGNILLDMPLSRQDLAEMTGTTLYSTSRILSAWEQKSVVEAGREKITILDLDALDKIANDLSS